MIFTPDFSKGIRRKHKEKTKEQAIEHAPVAEKHPAPEYPDGDGIVDDVSLDVLIPDFEVSPIEPDEEYFGPN